MFEILMITIMISHVFYLKLLSKVIENPKWEIKRKLFRIVPVIP